MFSSRLPSGLTPNAVSRAAGEARRDGRLRFDLTETNPTRVGLAYPASIPGHLAAAESLVYQPSPFGLEAARRAVAARCLPIPFEHVVLTASTSEAYSLLFKLLCDPGDEVLVPRPSYPLFELLTRLDGVSEAPYRLDAQGAWCLDRDSLERAVSGRTRAVLVVSPNNPTGSRLRASDREWLVTIARARDLAIVSDEVFADFPLAARPGAASFLGEDRVLTFTLAGLSKSAGLPQMKLAWILVSGPRALVADALDRLAVIADSYLSVSTPVQIAAARLLDDGDRVRVAIQARLERNLASLQALVAATPEITLFAPEGGWSAVVRVPAILSEEQFVLRLLAEHGVLLHPGYFFDIDGDGFLVTSLLPEPAVFDEGLARLGRFVSGVTV